MKEEEAVIDKIIEIMEREGREIPDIMYYYEKKCNLISALGRDLDD